MNSQIAPTRASSNSKIENHPARQTWPQLSLAARHIARRLALPPATAIVIAEAAGYPPVLEVE